MARHAGLSPAAAERAALCDLFDEVGEAAPTIDEGWNAADLATHLVVRETRPDALAGLIIPPLHGYTAKVEAAKRAATPFSELVARVRSGPPFWSPLGLPVVRDKGNLHEFFIHHEDVRRAQPAWKVRELEPATTAGLWDVVRIMAPMLAKGLTGTRVDLKTRPAVSARWARSTLNTRSASPASLARSCSTSAGAGHTPRCVSAARKAVRRGWPRPRSGCNFPTTPRPKRH